MILHASATRTLHHICLSAMWTVCAQSTVNQATVKRVLRLTQGPGG